MTESDVKAGITIKVVAQPDGTCDGCMFQEVGHCPINTCGDTTTDSIIYVVEES